MKAFGISAVLLFFIATHATATDPTTYVYTFKIAKTAYVIADAKTATEAPTIAAVKTATGLASGVAAQATAITGDVDNFLMTVTITGTSAKIAEITAKFATVAAFKTSAFAITVSDYTFTGSAASAVFPATGAYVVTFKIAKTAYVIAAAKTAMEGPTATAVVTAGSTFATPLQAAEVAAVATEITGDADKFLMTVTITSSSARIAEITTVLAATAAQSAVLTGITFPSTYTLVAGSAVFPVASATPSAPAAAPAPAAPAGEKKFIVKLSFSGSAPTGGALTLFRTAIADKMAATLFGGKIRPDDIVVSVSEGRRRLLAFTATGTVTSNDATISALQTAYSQNAAAFESAVKADTTLKAYGYTGLSANTALSFMASSIAVAVCMLVL